jgi:hypothetical protein
MIQEQASLEDMQSSKNMALSRPIVPEEDEPFPEADHLDLQSAEWH